MSNRIRELRQEKRITQVELSIELGVTQETISGYEHGTHNPSLASLLKMADLFDASMDYIMGMSLIRERANENTKGFDAQRETLLRCYRLLGDKNKACLVAYAQGLLDSQR